MSVKFYVPRLLQDHGMIEFRDDHGTEIQCYVKAGDYNALLLKLSALQDELRDAKSKAIDFMMERDSALRRLSSVREQAETWTQPQHDLSLHLAGNRILNILDAAVERQVT